MPACSARATPAWCRDDPALDPKPPTRERPAADRRGPLVTSPAALAGVDGCRSGWVAAIDAGDGGTRVQWFAGFADVLESTHLRTVAVDIPIGLLARGPRACDVLARKLLGPQRGSSVFPAPVRAMLESTTWEEACAARSASEGKRCSRQAFAILDKIRSVDRAMTPEQQERVVEVHPEVCFAVMTGEGPIAAPKRTAPGRRERERRLLAFFPDLRERVQRLPGVQVDDVLDAYACLWTARRIDRGEAIRMPSTPECDARGLRAEIVV